jgi:putative two-component system response regulator
MSRILIADDAPALRVLLQRCIELGGHEAVVATDGSEAIDILRGGERIDAVVTDHRMPGASGVEVITEAHRIDPMLPCVIVTAHDDLDVAVEAMHAGADAFLPKPFRPEHLLAVLDRTLERRRMATAWAAVNPVLETPLQGERSMVLGSRAGRELGLSAEMAIAAGLGAALRDMCLPVVTQRLLAATALFPGAEEALRRNHVTAAAALLEGVEGAEMIRLAVLHHHERWDGAGYPDGLAGAQIPIVARIAAAVDAFEDFADRDHGWRPTLREASDHLMTLSGTVIDPEVVEALLAALGGDDRYLEVTGRTGKPSAAAPRRPQLEVRSGSA